MRVGRSHPYGEPAWHLQPRLTDIHCSILAKYDDACNRNDSGKRGFCWRNIPGVPEWDACGVPLYRNNTVIPVPPADRVLELVDR